MPKLLVVGENCAIRKVERGIRKTVDEDRKVQDVGDIIDIIDDSFVPSSTEKDIFDIIEISNVERKDLIEHMKIPFNEDMTQWFDKEDGEWKVYGKRSKFPFSIKDFTQNDIADLKSKAVDKDTTINLFKSKVRNKIKLSAKNRALVKDLNNG